MEKTPPRVFEKPVAWLFGPQLIGGLKGILLYTAYGDKLDPRDWMTGEVFSFFIRFRLTQDSLTGYVIAVDDVSQINTVDDKGRTRDGSDLKPKLIDVFHLRCK